MHTGQPVVLSRRLVMQILATALVARCVFMVVFQTWDFYDNWQFGQEIGGIGRSIAEGHGFAMWNGLTAKFPPVYPLVVAGVFWLLGAYTVPSALVLFFFQSLCAGLAALCLVVFGSRCFGRRAGIMAGFVWAVYPSSLFHSAAVIWYSELAILLLLVVMLVATSAKPVGLSRRIAQLGGLSALLVLTDSSMLVVAVLMLVWILHVWHVRPQTWIGLILIWSAVAGAAFSPWAARNWLVFGTPGILKSNFGLELFFGNNPYSSGGTLDQERRKALAGLDQTELAGQRAISERAYFGYLQAEAVEWIRLNPVKFLRLTGVRFWNFWGKFPSQGPDRWRHYSWFHLLWWAPLVGLAVYSAARRAARSAALVPMWLFLLAYPIPYYITHVQLYRYRYPVEPFIILLAAVPLSHLWARLAGSNQEARF